MFKYIKVRDVKSPEKGTDAAAGIDFFIPNEQETLSLAPNESIFIKSGLKMVIPEGQSLLMVNKSGWGKKGLVVGAQLVDSDYRGEVHLNLWNISKEYVRLDAGMKIVQGMIIPVPNLPPMQIDEEEFSVYDNTDRGDGGFGSTGLT